MVRFFIITILLVVSSCGINKNEFGMYRFKKYYPADLVKNDNIYKDIDTAAFYKLILNDEKDYFIDRKLDTIKYNSVNKGYKFYKNGKVGYFESMNIENKLSFNPQISHMGYYGYKNGNIYIELMLNHPQSGIFLSRYKIVKIEKDMLYIFISSNAQGGGYEETLRKEKIPKEFLIYKPDW